MGRKIIARGQIKDGRRASTFGVCSNTRVITKIKAKTKKVLK